MEPPTTIRLGINKVLGTGVGNGADDSFGVFFFSLRIIHEFFGTLEEDGSLGVALLSI